MRWFWGCCLCWISTVQAALPEDLQAALSKAQLPQDSVAIVVQPVEGGPPVLQHNAGVAMNPASVMKLVTTYAALEALSPAYRWKTEVYREGALRDGVLEGNLILKGYGDPAFNHSDFWRLLQQVQQLGIRKIKGNLILDTSVYAPAVSTRAVLDNEPWRAYNTNPSAILLNGNHSSFRFGIDQTRTPSAVSVTSEFPLPQVQLINRMQVRQGACTDWRSDLQYTVIPQSDHTTVVMSGTLPVQCDERFLELSVLSDTQYMFSSFKKLWQSLGGEFEGQLQLAPLPSTASLLTTWWSTPLDSVIRDINKWSNNVMARQLMLTLGLEAGFTPVDESSAALAMIQALRQRGLVFPELVLENGSGLSRQERISAAHLAQLLVTAYQRPVMPVFMASLPILGMDGTTRKRLTDSPSKGMGYLKTGSLEGVSAIAGYVQDIQGKRYALVMLVNHARTWTAKPVQDLLIRRVIEGH